MCEMSCDKVSQEEERSLHNDSEDIFTTQQNSLPFLWIIKNKLTTKGEKKERERGVSRTLYKYF